MSEADEIAVLRKEVADLREEVVRLKAQRLGEVHYHYHGQPTPTYIATPYLIPTGAPLYPGGPWPVTCSSESWGGLG